MSMSEKTEHWLVRKVDGRTLITVGSIVIAEMAQAAHEEDATRIAACVNKGTGFTTKKLESGDLVLVPRDEFRGLQAKCAELDRKLLRALEAESNAWAKVAELEDKYEPERQAWGGSKVADPIIAKAAGYPIEEIKA